MFHPDWIAKQTPAQTSDVVDPATPDDTDHAVSSTSVHLGKLRPDAIEEEDVGDGTVPTWSGFTSSLQRQFVGGEHGTIYVRTPLKYRRRLRALVARPPRLPVLNAGGYSLQAV